MTRWRNKTGLTHLLACSIFASVLSSITLGCGVEAASRQNASQRSAPHLPVVVAETSAGARKQDDAQAAEEKIDWRKDVADVLGKAGNLSEKEQVYTVSVPRDDLDVKIDGMSVPTGAGIGSTFHFYHCSCGKMSVLGEFVLADYEANDVIDALRTGAIIRITAVSPLAIGDKPRLLSVRFHGEGELPPLAKLIKAAMGWTGEARMQPRKE